MAIALKKNCQELLEINNRLTNLTDTLLYGLNEAKIDYIRNGTKNVLPGNINLSFRGFNGEALLHRLDLMGICVSAGSACDSINTQISHVIKAIGLPEEYAKGTIRISLGKDNTEKDVHRIVECLCKILKS
uniref:aminotransferase class V-fold PLP-dependent enzyme n=1 Tax=Agathobacter sp. TaxID=2021311 RepID=UPI00405621A1